MKIALVSTSVFPVPPKSYGGLEMIVYDLASVLAKQHDVTVAGSKGSKVSGCNILETVEFTGDLSAFGKEEEAYKIYREKLSEYDIVHDNSWSGWPYIRKMELAKENPVKELKVIHTHHGHMQPQWLPLPNIPHMNMIGISDFMAREMSSFLGVPVERVYNGVDLERYQFSKNKGERLLYVGRLATYKGAHEAINAAKKVGMGLDIAGGHTFVESQEYVSRIYNECDGELIRWWGDVPHDVKIKLMQQAKALLFPSMMGEPFGLVAVEAMACGTPVIAYDDGAIKEVVSADAGFVVPYGKMPDVIDKISTISPEDCRKRAELFSRENMASSYEGLYREIVEQGKEW